MQPSACWCARASCGMYSLLQLRQSRQDARSKSSCFTNVEEEDVAIREWPPVTKFWFQMFSHGACVLDLCRTVSYTSLEREERTVCAMVRPWVVVRQCPCKERCGCEMQWVCWISLNDVESELKRRWVMLSHVDSGWFWMILVWQWQELFLTPQLLTVLTAEIQVLQAQAARLGQKLSLLARAAKRLSRVKSRLG